MGLLDKLINRKKTREPRMLSAGEIQAINLKRVMITVGAIQTGKPAEVFKIRHLAGLTLPGAASVPAQVPVNLTRGSMRDIDPWWHTEPVRRHYRDDELTEDLRVGKTDRFLVKTETRDIVLLDGRKMKTIRKIYYDKKKDLHSKVLLAEDEAGNVFDFNQIPANLMTLDRLDIVTIGPEKDVLVTEGYPAAETLRKRGVDAVAIISGTFEYPSERTLAPLLNAAHIVLWPDNDSAGVHLMSGVARILDRMGARVGQIKLVFWRDGPRKGDAYDFTGSDEELYKLLGEAVTWSPELRFATSSIKSLSVGRVSPQLRLDPGVQPPTPELLREHPSSTVETILAGIACKLSEGQPLSDAEKELLDSLVARSKEMGGLSNDH